MAITQKPAPAGFVLSEASGSRSRESVSLAATASDLEAGTLLGIVTASGLYAPYKNTNSNGTETATAILLSRVEASASAQKAAVIARDAEVVQAQLIGGDAPALVDLIGLGIIAR